jgi:hypothetical protein
MQSFKRIFLFLLGGALVCAADLASVHTVYVLPMSHGLDQHLANRLTNEHTFQVVTDAKMADAVLTDHIGEGLQSRLEELIPPPAPPKPEPKAEKDKDATPSGANPLEPSNKLEAIANTSSVAHAHGTVFLVDTKSREVLWSTYDLPKDASSREMDRIASDIVSRIKKDLSPKKK